MNRHLDGQLVRRGRVLISTISPLGGSFGGLLQAYALQRVITELGFLVTTINVSDPPARVVTLLRRLRYESARFLGLDNVHVPLGTNDRVKLQSQPRKFLAEHINTIDLFSLPRDQQATFLEGLHAIVVGSDQVWRRPYVDIRQQFLRFAEHKDCIKLSYAASFGKDNLNEYEPALQVQAAVWLQDFNSVSVRESSGVEICKNLGIEATQHVDPTLLLAANHYKALMSSEIELDSQPQLLYYVLDESIWTRRLSATLASKLGLRVKRILPEEPRTLKDFQNDPHSFRLPSISHWLSGIANADFVFTDSFHGTVFSLIFNVPFMVVGNSSRGLSRIHSLLSLFGLEDRFVAIGSQVDDLIFPSEPDWSRTNEIIERERERGIAYLNSNLAKHSRV